MGFCMPFRNRTLAKRIAKQPCAWCGWTAGRRHAAHIIDERPDEEWNAISLCPNCSTVFDEVVRPKFYRALQEFGCVQLPPSWKKDNKISEHKEIFTETEYDRLMGKLKRLNKRKPAQGRLDRIVPVDEQAKELLERVKKR